MVGEDVVVEDLAELLVGDTGHGAVIGIAGGIADEDVDRAEPHFGLGNEGLKARLVTDGRGDGDGALLPVALVDGGGDLAAGLGLARGDDDARAGIGKRLGDGASDPPRRAGDDGDPAGQVEQALNSIRIAHGKTSKRPAAPMPPPTHMVTTT